MVINSIISLFVKSLLTIINFGVKFACINPELLIIEFLRGGDEI